MAKIEFYLRGSDKNIAYANDGAVPRKGESVNIRKITYRVRRVTWAVDNADTSYDQPLRANVELDAPKEA